MKRPVKASVLFDRLLGILGVLTCAVIAFVWVLVCAEIVMRYFFNRPIAGVLELTETSILYITFLGAAWLLKKRGHVVVDILVLHVSPRAQALLNTITSIMGAMVCSVIFWYGIRATWDNFQRDVFLPTPLELRVAPIIIIIPIGSLLLVIEFAREAYGHLRSWRSGELGVVTEQGKGVGITEEA